MPTARPPARPRRRPSARPTDRGPWSCAPVAAHSRSRCFELLDLLGRRALLRAEDACRAAGPSSGLRTSQATESLTPRRRGAPRSGRLSRLVKRAPSASSAPRPPSVVALPPTATMTSRAPASIAAAISSPVPVVDAATASRSSSASRQRPEAWAASTIASRPSSAKRERGRHLAPQRIGPPRQRPAARAARRQRLHRALAAVGDRHQLDVLEPPIAPGRGRSPRPPRVRTACPCTCPVRPAPGGRCRCGQSPCERALERLAGPVAADAEDDQLQAASRGEVAAHLLRPRSGGLLDREASDAGAECHQRERLRSQLIRCGQRGGGGTTDDVGRGRAAQLHRRRVDHPARRHLAGARLDRFARGRSARPLALFDDRRAARARDRAGHAAAVQQLRVRRVGDRIDLAAS